MLNSFYNSAFYIHLHALSKGMRTRKYCSLSYCYCMIKCITHIFCWLKGRGFFDKSKHCNFFKILPSKCSLFAADRCKTVGTKQDILSGSKILKYLYKKHEFLANFCQLAKKCSLLRTLLSLFEV